MVSRLPLPLMKAQKITQDIYIIRGKNWGVNREGVLVAKHGEKYVLFWYLSGIAFVEVVQALVSVAYIDQIEAIVLPEPDPYVLSSLKEAELMKGNLSLIINTTKYNAMLAGIKNLRIVHIGDYADGFILENGDVLKFLVTPFIVTPHSFITYDETNKYLYSNHLFEYVDGEDTDATLLEKVYAYLSQEIPSSDYLKPHLERLVDEGISQVVTRSGKLIASNDLANLIEGLAKRPFYNYAGATAKGKPVQTDNYEEFANQIIAKLRNFYSDNEIRSVFNGSPVTLDNDRLTLRMVGQNPRRLWHQLFDVIYAKKGISWLGILEPVVNKLAALYQVDKPVIYRSAAIESERKVIELDTKKQELDKTLDELKTTLSLTIDRLLKDPLTGMYNQLFLEEHLTGLLSSALELPQGAYDLSLLFLNLDNIASINTKYGKDIGDETIRNVAFLLTQLVAKGNLLVKRNGPGFIIVSEPALSGTVRSLLAKIQSTVSKADIFVEPTTISGALVFLSEVERMESDKDTAKALISLGESRIRKASRLGPSAFVDRDEDLEDTDKRRILVVDDDEILGKLLVAFFQKHNYEVIVKTDGKAALDAAMSSNFDVFIVAKNIAKIDGFTLKNRFNDASETINTLFFLTLYNKTPEIVIRANRLGIDYVIQKPLIFPEILGLIERNFQGSSS